MLIKKLKPYEPIDKLQWHVWFAWYPIVTIDHELVWNEQVYRKFGNYYDLVYTDPKYCRIA